MERILKALIGNKALISLAISLVTAQLAATVKNPNSPNAQALVFGVEELRDAADQFLASVKPPAGK